YDIGFQWISGCFERGHNMMYVCLDNEAYANTGMQASGATPWGSSTTTTPSGIGETIDAIGSHQSKKDMIAIALAHGLNYVAQTTVGYNYDIEAKVNKAVEMEGPAYIQILSPCIPGWKINPSQAPEMGRLAAQTGLYPQLEYVNGKLINKTKIVKKIKVEEYLKPQGRFKHLFNTEQGRKQIEYIQELADKNIEKYGLME
ncbi:pyruvate ferredoxin oxidoreductase, partial [Candidatus Parcubacteria bacterium]|nr:pyruvate ferredoxin oxidoreductase [Candidatus Parcubacteria bacterium]